jgi:mannosylglycerate hydrolase MGH1-like protein
MSTLLFFLFMAGLTPAMVSATAADPVFTTYAAPLHRSEYLLDEGYHLRFYSPREPLALTTDTAGDWGVSFRVGEREVSAVADYAAPPRIEASLSSLARLSFQPAAGLEAKATFAVWSSRAAVLDLTIANESPQPVQGAVVLWYRRPEGTHGTFQQTKRGVTFSHAEPPANLSETPPPGFTGRFRDLLAADRGPDGVDATDTEARLRFAIELAPGAERRLRFVRAVGLEEASAESLESTAQLALHKSEEDLVEDASKPYRSAYDPGLTDPVRRQIYWSALNLARQCMLPGEGKVRYNYYVFSREPTWGWGHDGQVFHESLSMLAYALFDARSAMDSQRIFMEAQDGDGYIPYRIGPYAVRTFPVKGERTTSAPFLSWTNWEVYRTARDLQRKDVGNVEREEARRFLRQALGAGESFMRFWLDHRDVDHDGLFEWGGNAVLESVRDSQVPIWDLLGKDDPTAPSLVEAVDLNSMLVREMRALGDIAEELRETGSAARWRQRADALAARVNETMWDPETRFYYNVDRATNGFTVKTAAGASIDLRRKEIIGFLPLWAGIAPPDRAQALVQHLTNPSEFWRRYGVPTLAADDPGYEPNVTRCCQWNGAVWLEWNYLVFDGLRRYGYKREARELGERMIEAAATQLRRNHRFWESYSPDGETLASPQNYIWDSILARVIVDLRDDER